MRNLKRALSLVLASIMLLGMMVTGAGAVSTISNFTDADQINNVEAAEVTAGIGIFEGYNDGTFGPDRVVTRAEMAVIICKILNGPDVDPGNFTGVKIFNDVPEWAEGYVNYCHTMKIVVGTGEGKFDPSEPVTTVQAATMLLKALGYYIDDNAQLGADWKTTVTGEATYLKLYGDLTLGVDEGLTRDNVAELVFNTLFAQRVAFDDNRNLYVKNTDRDVVVTNGTNDPDNTFAKNTFSMWYIDGIVTANSCTNDSLSETVNNAPRTDVLFDDSADYVAMGGERVTHYPFEYTTGLDMIGHAARVYYKMERKAPVVYAIVDRATKVEYITYDGNNTNLANAANAAGFRRNTILNVNGNAGESSWLVNYSWNDTVGSLNASSTASKHVTLSGPDVSKTLVVISNSSDYNVDCVIVLDQYLDTVKRVYTNNDVVDYDLTTANATRLEVPHDTFAQGDYVIVTDIGKQGVVLNFEKPELVDASISKITGKSDANATVKSIVADGTTYTGSPVAHHKSASVSLTDAVSLDNTVNFERIETIGQTTLILDFQGKCVGLGEPESLPNYAYAAQFGQMHVSGRLGTDEVLSVLLYFADGTSGVYAVNTDLNRFGNAFYGYDNVKLDNTTLDNLNNGTSTSGYVTPVSVDSDNDLVVTGTGLGIYEAHVRSDGTVVLTALQNNYASRANSAKARMVAGLSTMVVTNVISGTTNNGELNTAVNGDILYQTSKTVYFYVNGKYDKVAKNDTLDVAVKVGVNNAKSYTIDDTKDGDNNGWNERYAQVLAWKQTASSRNEVRAVLIHGLEVDNSDNLYLYKEGNYHLNDRNGTEVTSRANEALVSITYDLYNASTGELKQQTYNNNGKYYDVETAKSEVQSIPTGFYTIGRDDLNVKMAVGSTDDSNVAKQSGKFVSGKYVFVINSEVQHVEYQTNLFTKDDKVGGISADTKIIDLTGKDLFHSVGDIQQYCEAKDVVTISYYYEITGDNSYKIKVVFVTGYTPKEQVVDRPNFDNATLWAEASKNYMSVKLYNEGDKSGIIDIRDSIAAAYETAGFTVTNPVLLGTKTWGLTISGNGLANPVNIAGTNGISEVENNINVTGFYLPIEVVRTAKVTGNGKTAYYAKDETAKVEFSDDVTAVFTSINGKSDEGNPCRNHTWTKVIDGIDLSTAITVTEAVEVNFTDTAVEVTYTVGGGKADFVEDGGFVPVGATLKIKAIGETAEKSTAIKVTVDGKTTAGEAGKPAEFTYKVTSKKAVTISAADSLKLVVGPNVLVTYKDKDGVEGTLTDGEKSLEKGWKVLKAELTGTQDQNGIIVSKNEAFADSDNLMASSPTPFTAPTSGSETEAEKDTYFHAVYKMHLQRGVAAALNDVKIEATYDVNTGKDCYVAVGTTVTLTGPVNYGTYFKVNGEQVNNKTEADGLRVHAVAEVTMGAAVTGIETGSTSTDNSSEIILPGTTENEQKQEQLKEYLIGMGLRPKDAETYSKPGSMAVAFNRPDCKEFRLRIYNAQDACVSDWDFVYDVNGKPAQNPAVQAFAVSGSASDYMRAGQWVESENKYTDDYKGEVANLGSEGQSFLDGEYTWLMTADKTIEVSKGTFTVSNGVVTSASATK